MGVTNTRDLVPFVNELEKLLLETIEEVNTWKKEKGKILAYGVQIDQNKFRANSAFAKVEEALGEILNATGNITALKGQRLKKLIDNLKGEVIRIAEESMSSSGGGGGGAYDERIMDEVNAAVAEVSTFVPDGLKLDWRIQEIKNLAEKGGTLGDKVMVVPMRHKFKHLGANEVLLTEQDGLIYVKGEVALLTKDGDTVHTTTGTTAIGKIEPLRDGREARILLPEIVMGDYVAIHPAELKLKDWPEEAIMSVLDATLSRTSPTFVKLDGISLSLEKIQKEIELMKGENWTVDVSLMRNHRDIIRESITPKGLRVDVVDGKAIASFSYNADPALSHFIVETMDESGEFKPFDGEDGILMP